MTCQVRDEEWLFSSEAVECDLWHLLKRGSFEIDLNWQGVATTFYEQRVQGGFWTVPPHFQCQNEPTSSFFTLKISWNCSPGWLQLVLHFSTENREEQLKNTLYIVIFPPPPHAQPTSNMSSLFMFWKTLSHPIPVSDDVISEQPSIWGLGLYVALQKEDLLSEVDEAREGEDGDSDENEEKAELFVSLVIDVYLIFNHAPNSYFSICIPPALLLVLLQVLPHSSQCNVIRDKVNGAMELLNRSLAQLNVNCLCFV